MKEKGKCHEKTRCTSTDFFVGEVILFTSPTKYFFMIIRTYT